ncbi:hypothetical protein BD626DRAFT_533720 [Schizophyllum amplum]|uniref:Short-chain dehydrogenase/reductase n=1 Tax=Schizophyllum amplum TaxID=97359 RepID=A0A550D0C6_9AGAR|nr:hypothetical protein BD626DRAFT_533720 [Auriculariopsis ampla]
MNTEQKTVLITGCSAGSIGDALAREFKSRGFRVFAASRTLDSMESLAKDGIETVVLDITSDANVAEARDEISKRTGGSLDVLVNNAGVAYSSTVADCDMDKVRWLFEVNVFGHYATTRAFIPLLIKSKAGLVMFNSSLASLVPIPFNSVYGASKAAVNLLSDTLRVELAPFGVKVVNLITGNVASNIGTTHRPKGGLPENSIYKPVEETYIKNMEHFQDNAISREVFAKGVVDEAMKQWPSTWFWSGNQSTLVWLMTTFGKRTAFDGMMSKANGFDKLAEIVRAKRS